VAGEQHLCLHCLEGQARPVYRSRTENELAEKLWGRLPLNGAFALWSFATGAKAQHIIHSLKYKENAAACRYLGRYLGRNIKASLAAEATSEMPWHAVAFVPMHWAKERKRGYNQAQLLAEGVAIELNLPLVHAIKKNQGTASQTRLSRLSRWENARRAFAGNAGTMGLEGQNVLLVDDVVTTGATLEGAAQPLMQAGVHYIGLAVLANVL